MTAIVFDGDDTLWFTEELYDDARSRARAIVESAGNDGARWETLERAIDVQNVARFAHSPERFPTSCVEAYREVSGTQADQLVADDVWDAASSVFTSRARVRGDARIVLERLAASGAKLVLLTKGDSTIQWRRIDQSGLEELFDVTHVVDRKTPATFERVVRHLGGEPASAVSIGNSVQSDVLPAIEAGLEAVWIPAHVWEFERQRDSSVPEKVWRVSSLAEVLSLVG